MSKRKAAGGPQRETGRLEPGQFDSDPSEDTIETHTGSLYGPNGRDLPFAMTMPYAHNRVQAYRTVPKELAQIQERHKLPLWAWRVEFHSLAPDATPLGLDILGPIILG